MRSRLNLLLSVGIVILLAGVVSSQGSQTLGTLRLNEDAFLIQNCANCTYVNITTIILANKTSLVLNTNMTQEGSFYYYLLDSSYITYPGEYIVNGIADPDGVNTIWNYNFFVSQLAISQTTSQSIGSAVFLVLMVILMFTFGILGFRMFKTDKWWVVGIFFCFFASLLLIYNTWLGFQYHKLFTGLPDSAVPERIFWIMLALIVSSILASLVLLFVHWRKVIKYIKKEARRKEPSDEDLEDWDVDRWGGEDWSVRR